MSSLRLLRAALMAVLAALSLVAIAEEGKVRPLIKTAAWVYPVSGNFADVKEDLIRAIEAQGAVVSYTAHSSAMLDRTAVTLNIKQKVYQDSEVILFCKAEIAHQLVQSDPHSLVLCPYPIAIYTLAGEPETVYLAIRKPPENMPEYKMIQTFLLAIITDTIEF